MKRLVNIETARQTGKTDLQDYCLLYNPFKSLFYINNITESHEQACARGLIQTYPIQTFI